MRKIEFEHPYWGVIKEQFDTKGEALRWALSYEHGNCDDIRCDITNMMHEDYYNAAAQMLMGATDELHFLYAVTDKFGGISRRIADKEQGEWYNLVAPFARRCLDCNGISWGNENNVPESCASCEKTDLAHLEGFEPEEATHAA